MQLLSLGNNTVKLSCGCIIYLKLEKDSNLVEAGLEGLVLDEAKFIQSCKQHTAVKKQKYQSSEKI